jgi:mannose-1-phosphate guanylyltransferase / mannose-6-phosphate isomerase
VRSVTPVILCGGSGTRLWPLSRAGFPKQFLTLQGSSSLFQNTVTRMLALASTGLDLQPCLVVTHEDHRFLALEQMRELKLLEATLLLEPVARNTAAALTLAALQATHSGGDSILVTSPSDHYLADSASYTRSLHQAIDVAATGAIATLGIQPDLPETGYGYIQCEQGAATVHAKRVIRFVEKPSLALAQQYVASGDFVWNGGIFVLKASVWLKALGQFRPDILQACQLAWRTHTRDALLGGLVFVRPDVESFSEVPAESIDYAVMEKCPESGIAIEMVALEAGWSDLGAWDAVWQVGEKDEHGNVSQGDVLLNEASGNLIHASSRLVSVVGVKDLAIVETADAILIVDKSNSQSVKAIVAQLGQSGRSEQNRHRKVHRPWGWYDNLDVGERFKVNRVCVNPGASLSLQKHQHRAEHWIVVKGSASVTCGDKTVTLIENQSTYIPLGESHQLSNTGDDHLEIIEVQSGHYLGDDDIIRLDNRQFQTHADEERQQ